MELSPKKSDGIEQQTIFCMLPEIGNCVTDVWTDNEEDFIQTNFDVLCKDFEITLAEDKKIIVQRLLFSMPDRLVCVYLYVDEILFYKKQSEMQTKAGLLSGLK